MDERLAINEKLRIATLRCNSRGLNIAATWACEQFMGMDITDDDCDSKCPILIESIYAIECVPKHELNQILFATSLMANGEYQRSAFIMQKECINKKKLWSNLGLFLTYYAQYLAGEKLRDQLYSESTKVKVTLTSKQKASDDSNANEKVVNHNNNLRTTRNSFLVEIYNALLPLYRSHAMDSFLLYLFAVVVRDMVTMHGLPVQAVMSSLPGHNSSTRHTKSSVNSSRVDDSTDSVLSTEQDLPDNVESKLKSTAAASDRGVFDARQLFIESIALFPWNWSCWLDLSAHCVAENLPVPEWSEILQAKTRIVADNTSKDGIDQKMRLQEVDTSSPQQHQQQQYSDEKTMYVCFLVHVYLEMQRGDLAMEAIEVALPTFPTSLSLRAQIGLSLYSARDYDRAQASFEMIRDADPYRVSYIDTYSNILYIKEKQAELSLLAHTLVKVDKYAPETCCVVGNYYSLKGQHDRAITYFRRAISVNSQYLSAWTLMGHEYIELHNSATAITCYRQALNISESDFRAWYGLGQTYEMLHLYQYASYYFKKAAVLRPGDARMWSAVGNCLLKLGVRDEAIAIFERAVECGDSEGISTRELARLCRSEGQTARAAEFYLKYLETTAVLDGSFSEESNSEGAAAAAEQRNKGASGGGSMEGLLEGILSGDSHLETGTKIDADQAEALLFLANYHKSIGNKSMTERYCHRLSGFNGAEGDEARAMLKGMRVSSVTPLKRNFDLQRPSTAPRGSSNAHPDATFSRTLSAIDKSRRSSQQFYSPSSTVTGDATNRSSSHYLNMSYDQLEEEAGEGNNASFTRSGVSQSRTSNFQDTSDLQTALFPGDSEYSVHDNSIMSSQSETSEQRRYREEGILDDSTVSADSTHMMSVDSPALDTPPSQTNSRAGSYSRRI